MTIALPKLNINKQKWVFLWKVHSDADERLGRPYRSFHSFHPNLVMKQIWRRHQRQLMSTLERIIFVSKHLKRLQLGQKMNKQPTLYCWVRIDLPHPGSIMPQRSPCYRLEPKTFRFIQKFRSNLLTQFGQRAREDNSSLTSFKPSPIPDLMIESHLRNLTVWPTSEGTETNYNTSGSSNNFLSIENSQTEICPKYSSIDFATVGYERSSTPYTSSTSIIQRWYLVTVHLIAISQRNRLRRGIAISNAVILRWHSAELPSRDEKSTHKFLLVLGLKCKIVWEWFYFIGGIREFVGKVLCLFAHQNQGIIPYNQYAEGTGRPAGEVIMMIRFLQ